MATSQNRRILGEHIRVHRKNRKVTQEQLAEKADLHPKYISEIERGAKTISVDALGRIAKALGTTVHDLTRGI
ncbi:MAG TPA: helix-turn-helix transcriptional regulator [Candidatus Angelobacter sp.]|nr:helix-turn-helix transcriptional regulator [Candidatus Angelobacter sp.]